MKIATSALLGDKGGERRKKNFLITFQKQQFFGEKTFLLEMKMEKLKKKKKKS